ncbi:helix-turn-helix domain-containing protein [Nocardia sp. CS682]|uniref:helix-turn-helix domain-containing protein n=1 Tax=Nocardia sp. CS682 TaxID=1047172 RepID=UPI001430B38C|nr:helix-turn-helix transcriptional regulator [Nocardia sp. CS682]
MSNTHRPKTGPLTIGERLELLRHKHGLTRRVLAEQVGRSEEWLRLVESGKKPLDSIAIALRLAEALHIKDIGELIALPPQMTASSTEAASGLAESLERSIIDHPSIRAYGYKGTITYSVPDLTGRLRQCQEDWKYLPTRYTRLAERLPTIVSGARMLHSLAQAENSVPRADEVGILLLRSYHLSRRFLTRVGSHNLAFTVADRAMLVADQMRNKWLIAACAWHIGHGMLGLSNFQECHDYTAAAAKRLAEVPDSVDKTVLIGALQLLAAKGAAAAGDVAESARLTAAATDVARQFDADRESFGIPFGPVEVKIAQLEIMLWGGDCSAAAELAAELHVPEDHPVGGRMRFHVASAYACARRNNYRGASSALSKAASVCPEDFRYSSNTQRTLRYLIKQDNRLVSPDVHRLARMAGLH